MKSKARPSELLGREQVHPIRPSYLGPPTQDFWTFQQSRYLPVCALNIFKMVSIFFIILVHFFTEQRHSIPRIKLYIVY